LKVPNNGIQEDTLLLWQPFYDVTVDCF